MATNHQTRTQTTSGTEHDRTKRTKLRIGQIAEHQASEADNEVVAAVIRVTLLNDDRLFELADIAEACYDVVAGRLTVVPTDEDIGDYLTHARRVDRRVEGRVQKLVAQAYAETYREFGRDPQPDDIEPDA